ncbi:cytochrome b5, partial [Phtheirospermum japonicum]
LVDILVLLVIYNNSSNVVKKFAGKDATEDFEDVGQSASAKAMIKEFMLAILTRRPFRHRKRTLHLSSLIATRTRHQSSSSSSSSSCSRWLS